MIDDEDTTDATQNWANSRIGRVLSLSNKAKTGHCIMKYRSEAIDDLKWLSTNTQSSSADCALKLYTSNTQYNTPVSTTGILSVSWKGLFQFRGLGANS